jgi:hypothetical protein
VMDRMGQSSRSTGSASNASRITVVLLVALLLSVSGAVLAKDEQIAEQDPDLIQLSAPVTPFVFSGDVRDLPDPVQWKPGDPIKEIPRRFFPPPGSAERRKGDRWTRFCSSLSRPSWFYSSSPASACWLPGIECGHRPPRAAGS